MTVGKYEGIFDIPMDASEIKLTFDDLIRSHISSFPDKHALVDSKNRPSLGFGNGHSYNYQQADQIISRISSLFLNHGLKAGDVVSIQLPNFTESPLIFLGAVRAGLIVTFLPFLWRAHELGAIFEKLNIKAIVCADQMSELNHADIMCQLAFANLSVRFIFGIGSNLPDGIIPINGLFNPESDVITEDPRNNQNFNQPETPVLISWTRDLDGTHQPFYRTQQELIHSGRILANVLALNADDSLLNTFPLTNLVGLCGMMMPWFVTGSTLIQHHPFDYEYFCEELEEKNVSYSALPDTVADIFQKEELGGNRSQSLKCLGSVSRTQNTEKRAEPHNKQTRIFDFFNLGEIALLASRRNAGRINHFVPLGSVRLDPDDDASPVIMETRLKGSVRSSSSHQTALRGTLMLKGSLIPKDAYAALPKPVAPDGSENFDGWVHTPVAASIAGENMNAVKCELHDGFLYHGGEVIRANELDDLYSAYPEFLDAAVFTIPDPLIGDRIFAAIVPAPGISPSITAFEDYLHEKSIAPFKIPEKLVIVSFIPRDDQGQVLRDQIIDKV